MMSQPLSERWIYAMLVYTTCVWGANVVAVKAMARHFGVVQLSAIRMWVAFACIALICQFGRHRIPLLTRAQLPWVAAAGTLMIYGHQVLLTQGLAWSSATHGALILGLNPTLSVLLGALVFGERLTGARMLGVALGLLGASVVVINRSGAQLHLGGPGDAVLLLSMLAYVAAGACIRCVVGQLHPLVIGFYIHLVGAGLLTLHMAFEPGFPATASWSPSASVWLLILFSGLFSTALGNVAWNYGISRIGLGRTSMFINLLPVSGLLFAVAFLGETLRLVHLIGLACVLAGTWLAVRGTRPSPGTAALS